MTDNSVKSFSDMPTDVIEVIVEHSELKEQLILRKVSRSLRDLIDTQKLDYKQIIVDARPDHIFVQFNEHFVAYLDHQKLDIDISQMSSIYKYTTIIRMPPGGDWIQTAFADLELALKNPKNRFQMIRIHSFDDDAGKTVYKKLENILKPLGDRKIHVTRFCARVVEGPQLLSILPHLQPGILKSIEIEHNVDLAENIDSLIDSQQWKKAQDVEMYAIETPIPIECLVHLRRFDVWIESIEVQDLLKLRDNLIISPIFESCSIRSYSGSAFDIVEVQKILGLKQPSSEKPQSMLLYSIPNSDAILEIYVDNHYVYIEKA